MCEKGNIMERYFEQRSFTMNEPVEAKLVSVGDHGELIYADYNGMGGKLIDFSYAGYRNGEQPIPDVKVVKVIEAGELSDHTALIQGAIDEVSALPVEARGAILLKAGRYTITGTLKIGASGIVLRGEGQGDNGSILFDARAQEKVTTLTFAGCGSFVPVSGTKRDVVGTYTPAGEATLALSDVSAYHVGDPVCVVLTPNDLWVQTLGMDVIPGANTKQWVAANFVMTYERWIVGIDTERSTVTLNTGIPLTVDSKYYSATVQRIEDSADRITECGVEDMRFISYYNGEYTDINHARNAMTFASCRNCWVRRVTAKHFAGSLATMGSGAINMTIEHCSNIEPISLVEGGFRYSFHIAGGQYILVKNCYSHDSRHDYVLASRVPGPNVFLNSVGEDGNAACEAHHRWSTGTLYDNIHLTGSQRLGYIQLVNRGNFGSGHGWAGANSVMWNCLAPAINTGKPQTEQNFAVGAYGLYDNIDRSPYLRGYRRFVTPSIETPNYPETQEFEGSPLYGNGYIEAPYNPVSPSGLYLAQLSFRLHGDARKGLLPCPPILHYPPADFRSEDSSVTISGIRDPQANAVHLLVDGEKYEAVLADDGSNAFSLILRLDSGYHEICATQVVGSAESEETAVRFVFVEEKID